MGARCFAPDIAHAQPAPTIQGAKKLRRSEAQFRFEQGRRTFYENIKSCGPESARGQASGDGRGRIKKQGFRFQGEKEKALLQITKKGFEKISAASYSPTSLPRKYHRRWRA